MMDYKDELVDKNVDYQLMFKIILRNHAGSTEYNSLYPDELSGCTSSSLAASYATITTTVQLQSTIQLCFPSTAYTYLSHYPYSFCCVLAYLPYNPSLISIFFLS